MVELTQLWLPIVLSAVGVFLASSVIHMLLTYHRKDFGQMASEAEVMAALRPFNLSPGEYVMPYSANNKEMGTPEFQEKLNQGPVGFITVWPSGPINMGASLIQWFIYCLVVGVFAAYLTGHAVGPGAEYMSVFRMVGTSAFLGYAVALSQNSIWYKRSWGATMRSTFDGLVYALITAGVFGWLWPGL